MPDPAAEPRTRAEMPSPTGLHVFAKREGLWESTAEALHVGGQPADEAVKNLLQAYHQKQLNLPLDQAVELVDKIPAVALHYYVTSMLKLAEVPMSQQATPVTSALSPAIMSIWEALVSHQPARSGVLKTDGQQVLMSGRPIFRILNGLVSASWAGRVTLSTASALNSLASLAGIPRPFKVGLGDGEAICNDQPVDPLAWIDLGPGPSRGPAMATASAEDRPPELGPAPVKTAAAAKTAVGYPQAVQDKGGDSAKVKQALEKAVHAMNEASTASLKFDDRLLKLERDVYALFREYLAYDQQVEAMEAQEQAQEQQGIQVPGRTASVIPGQEVMGARWHFKEHSAPAAPPQPAQIDQPFDPAPLGARSASLSTPPTDERAGEFDHSDVADEGDSVTAAAAPPSKVPGFVAQAKLLGKKN